jgi:hypothetical protein
MYEPIRDACTRGVQTRFGDVGAGNGDRTCPLLLWQHSVHNLLIKLIVSYAPPMVANRSRSPPALCFVLDLVSSGDNWRKPS